jgi:hypothetical protein
MNGVRYVVALVESLDPLVNTVEVDRKVQAAMGIAHDCVSCIADKSQQSETPYILLIALDLNFGPLAPCDPGSRSMKSGDFTC